MGKNAQMLRKVRQFEDSIREHGMVEMVSTGRGETIFGVLKRFANFTNRKHRCDHGKYPDGAVLLTPETQSAHGRQHMNEASLPIIDTLVVVYGRGSSC